MKVLPPLPSFECLPQASPMLSKVIRRAQPLLLLLLMFAGFLSYAAAQQFATVNLTVTDPAGSLIAQANASVRNVDTGVARAGVSDKLGLIVIPGLAAGQYNLTASADGFTANFGPPTFAGAARQIQLSLKVKF